MADKEFGLYADILGGLIDCVFTVSPDNPRSLDSHTMADTFAQKAIPAQAFPELSEGVAAAYQYAARKDIPLIALGSLYLYREFVSALPACQ